MKKPSRLHRSDEIRVIAPANSLSIISDENRSAAIQRLKDEFGFEVSFSTHCSETGQFGSASVLSRVSDLHEAFSDPRVKGILTVIGGYNCNQLLEHIDYDLIAQNPKVLCGFSDITALSNAIWKKTSMVTFSGPHFSTFACEKGMDFTWRSFAKCLMSDEVAEAVAAPIWSDDAWYLDQENRTFLNNEGTVIINEGEATGTILGGNLCTLNLLQGTSYMPDLDGSILFLEDDALVFPEIFDRDLQSLVMQPGFDGVRALVIGRFQQASKMSLETLSVICQSKPKLRSLPIIANVDFGHTLPIMTFPIGGTAWLKARDQRVGLKVEW